MLIGVYLFAAYLLCFAAADVVISNGGEDAGAPVVDSSSVLNYKTFSCNCPLIYKPVCGSDGKTYSNDCVLKCVSDTNVKNGLPPIYILKFGECPQVPCFCPAVVQPVCGSDSHTYSNECNLICESNRRQKLGLPAIYVVSQGSCSYFPCICSNVIIPVCGTDGRTYRNICYLQCASKANQAQGLPPIFYQNSGACLKETCLCTLNLNPVCASDGKTYDNNCLLQCENRRRNALGLYPLIIIKQGPCTTCPCPNINDPVCASDDKTYKSACFLDCENEARKKVGLPPLTILYKGVCGCNCNKKYEPVCGTDEITYDNLCLLQCESNKRVYQGQSPIFLAYFGQCVCNCRNCTTFFQPVCGSDAKTYWNICWLYCHSACNEKQGKPKITLVKYGYC